ncbi:hypothetical protein AB1K62_09540 [Parasphingorhabdus sp. JC815]|uniref:hypothetical protein n=1 Tax=Parasphingorhabdus sp. JC815 TaxID=3232140 RepID=UPI003458C334
MMRTLFALALIGYTASACSETTEVSDDLQNSQTDIENPTGQTERVGTSPGERPVRIGEGGPRFDACQGMGRVADLREAELEVLIAPFDRAKRKDALSIGQFVHICSRSHDQQWLGIVYAPAEDTDTIDCGVSTPVRSKRDYDGPCKSGWVESTFIKLVAG